MAARAYAFVVSVCAAAVRLAFSLWSSNLLSPSRWLLKRVYDLVSALGSRVWLVEYALSSVKWGHSSCVKSITVIGDHVYTGCWDFLVKKWDSRSGACLLTFVGHAQDIIGITANGRHLFSCGDFVRLWNTATGEEVACFGTGTYYCAIANEMHVFVAKANGAIEIFEYADAQGAVLVSGPVPTAERTLTGHLAGVMDFDMRGDILVSASIDLTARMWSIKTGELLQTFNVRARELGDPLERTRLASHPPRSLCLPWALPREQGHGDALRCCCLWHDYLFTGSLDRTIRQWSLASGECVGVVQKHGAAVRALLTVGDSLFSASSDFMIVEWGLNSDGCQEGADEFRQLRSLTGHSEGVFALCEQAGVLYSGSADCTCKRWSLSTGQVTQEYASRKPIEVLAVVAELLLRVPLREAFPLIATLRPLARLQGFCTDVMASAEPAAEQHQHAE